MGLRHRAWCSCQGRAPRVTSPGLQRPPRGVAEGEGDSVVQNTSVERLMEGKGWAGGG